MLSDSANERTEIYTSSSELTVVIATQGNEPRVFDQQGRQSGYDLVALLGGKAGFNSATLSRSDQYRRSWARIIGLVNPRRAHVFMDLERSHVEFIEASRSGRNSGIENFLTERKALFLPPYALLVQVFGEEASLIRMRNALESDGLFKELGSVAYPVQNDSFIIKVATIHRNELLRLLQSTVKLRSSKRLSPIRFVVSPENL